jgi:hypothetical protein
LQRKTPQLVQFSIINHDQVEWLPNASYNCSDGSPQRTDNGMTNHTLHSAWWPKRVVVQTHECVSTSTGVLRSETKAH